MNRIYLLAIFILFFTGFSFAQQRDPKAKAVLDAVSAKYKSFTTLSAGFGYQIQDSKGKILGKQSGTLKMKGDKYNISYNGSSLVSDGKTVWNYDPSAKEVTVNNASNNTAAITPQKLFTNFYDDGYMYIMAGEGKVGNKAVQKILLQPVDNKMPFSRLTISIDKATNMILSAYVVERTGNRYIYTMNNVKTNVSIPDTQFTFNQAAYPGVEVVDLR